MVWSGIAIEKLLRAIKHSRVLLDPFREWHYVKIGCAAKRFEKDASITRERLAAKLLPLRCNRSVRLLVFPSGCLTFVSPDEIDLSVSFSRSLVFPLSFSLGTAVVTMQECAVISRKSVKTHEVTQRNLKCSRYVKKQMENVCVCVLANSLTSPRRAT